MDEANLRLELESPSAVKRTVKGEIAWEPVKDKLDEAYKELSKNITLKGFRKGKVPRSVLSKMFHKRIAAEISHTLVQEALVDAVKRLDLRPIMPIHEWDITEDELEEGSPLSFTAGLEVLPEIEAKVFEGLEAKRREAKVSDEDVEHHLKMKQEELTQFVPVENRDLAVGDIVSCDVMGKIGGKPVSFENLAFRMNDPEAPLDQGAGDPERTAMVNLLSAQLMGKPASAGEHDLAFEFDETAPDAWQSKSAQLLVELQAVRERKIPTIDDDFARDIGEADSLDEYKALLRKQLLEMDEQRVQQELRQQIENELIEKNPIEVSQTLVEKQLNSVMERASMAFQMRGISPTPWAWT